MHLLPWQKKKPFLGWSVVGAGFLVQLITSAALNQTFGAYFVQIQREFGWSRTVLSGSVSLLSVVNGVVGPFQGKLLDTVGARLMATVGLFIFGAGLTALGFVTGLWQYYAVFFVIAVGAALSGFLTVLVPTANWFRRRRTTAMAVVGMGFGMGGLFVPLLALAMTHFGWRHTVTGSGIFTLVVAYPLARLIKTRPEDYGLLPDGDTVPPSSSALNVAKEELAEEDFTAAEAVRTPAFWLIALGHASAVLVVATVNVHFINYLVKQRGYSLALAGVMYGIVTVFQLLSQFAGGVIADRMDKRILAVVGMIGHVTGMLVLAFAVNLGMVLFFTVIHGLAWGLRGPLMSSIRADYFGRRAYGTIMGLSGLILLIGTVGGPLFSASLADLTGDYRLSFIVVGLLSGLGSLFFLAARKPTKPRRPAVTT